MAALARLLGTSLGVSLFSLLAYGVLPLTWGWQSYVVTSGSMTPLIRPGDVVVASPYDHRTPLRRDEVVVISPEPGTPAALRDVPVTHRVVERLPDGRYRTKGDANALSDTRLITADDVRAQARLVVPLLGQPTLQWLRHPDRVVLAGAGVGGAGLIALVLALAGGDRPGGRGGRRGRGGRGGRRGRDGGKGGGGSRPLAAGLCCAALVLSPLAGPRDPTAAAFSGVTPAAADSYATKPLFYAQAVIASGPVSYWRLGDTGTGVADTMGVQAMTTQGGPPRGSASLIKGDANASLTLGTGSYATTGASPSSQLAIPGAMTVAAWVQTSVMPQTTNARLVFKWNNTKLNYLLAFDSNGTDMRFVVENSANTTRVTSQITYPTDNRAHFVVGQFTGTVLKLFIDGQDAGVQSAGTIQTPLYTAAADPVTLSANDANKFRGTLDEVAIWNRALSASEITQLYTLGTT